MNKFAKRIGAMSAAVIMSICACVSASATETKHSIESDQIKLVTNSSRFDLFAKPSGKLLFTTEDINETSANGTSRIYVSIDGNLSDPSMSSLVIDNVNKTMTDTQSINGVNVERKFSITKNNTNKKEDALEIRLTITNDTSETKKVGARIFLDTMVEENDHAPLRATGIGQVTKITEFKGNDIPKSFQAFDSLENPKLIGTGTFATGADRPTAVQFTDYWENQNKLHPTIPENTEIDDSAVNAIWDERDLAPGKALMCRTYYGIGTIDVNKDSDLILGATQVDGEFTIAQDGKTYNPIEITSYISNKGRTTLTNAEMSIDLPFSVSTVDNKTDDKYAKLEINEEKQKTWSITAIPAPYERTVDITINAKSDETGAVKPVTYKYVIPAIEGAKPIATPDEIQNPTVPTTLPNVGPTDPTNVTPCDPSQDATSYVTPNATIDEIVTGKSTVDEAKKYIPHDRNAIQTGQIVPIVAILATTVAGVVTLFLIRRRQK